MTIIIENERTALNFLRYGEPGDCVESNDGEYRIVRYSIGMDTLPMCWIIEPGVFPYKSECFSQVREAVHQMIEYNSKH